MQNDIATSARSSEKGVIFDRVIATAYLLIMSVQIVPIEGDGVSTIKVVSMCLAPFVILIRCCFISRAILLGMILTGWIFACMFFQFDHPRIETMGYLSMFVVSHCAFYNLISKGSFSLDYFLQLTQVVIFSYASVLIVQQILSLLDFAPFPYINLTYKPMPVLKCQSLSTEPSHSARIMAAAFYAFLKTLEMKHRHPPTLKELFNKYKWLTCGFAYSMLSMCSGTAICCLAILSIYFLRKQYILMLLPIGVALYYALPFFEDMESVERAYHAVDATFSLDSEKIREADHSASFRIIPIVNMLKLDLREKTTWLGCGTLDSEDEKVAFQHSLDRVPEVMHQYGLIAYVLGQIFVFACCLPGIFSIATLFYIFLCEGGGPINMALFWSLYMFFAAIKLLEKQNIPLGKGDSSNGAKAQNLLKT